MPLGLRFFDLNRLRNVVFIRCQCDRSFLINRAISIIKLFDGILNDKWLFLFNSRLTVPKRSITEPSSSWFFICWKTGQHLSAFYSLDCDIFRNGIIDRNNFTRLFQFRRNRVNRFVRLDFDDLNAKSKLFETTLACRLTLVLPVTIINHGENHNKEGGNHSLDKYHSFLFFEDELNVGWWLCSNVKLAFTFNISKFYSSLFHLFLFLSLGF